MHSSFVYFDGEEITISTMTTTMVAEKMKMMFMMIIMIIIIMVMIMIMRNTYMCSSCDLGIRDNERLTI